MSNTISVLPCGDFELWTVAGRLPDDFAFTLPIKCAPFKNDADSSVIWFVRRGMQIAPVQYRALTPILDAWNYSSDDRGWWFRDSDLRRFANKAPGITPEYYIVWPGVEAAKVSAVELDPPPEPGFSSQEITFLKDLHYAIPEIGWDALKVFWLQVRAAALRRLSDRKTLDLGFVKIIPMPYRENWKEALAVRFSSLMSMFGKPPEERHQTFTLSGFYGALASPKLLALDRNKTFVRWTLETIPSPELERRVEEHELARKEKAGSGNYTSGVLGEMSRRLPAVLEIMKWYSVRVFYPPASVMDSKLIGCKILVPAVQCGMVRPGRGICDSVALTPEDAFREWTPDLDQRITANDYRPRAHGRHKMIAFKSSQDPWTEPDPSKVFQEDKSTQSPDTSTRSQSFEMVLDPLPAEPPDGTGEVSG